MNILEISIQNYKSLKSIEFYPGRLALLVGANASGKSNLADCIDFIAEVYEHGLEIAVGRKGGYENIAFRRMRRSKSPIKIALSVELDPRTEKFPPSARKPSKVRATHTFSFIATSSSIRADFYVLEETFVAEVSLPDDEWLEVFRLTRDKDEIKYTGNSEYAIDRRLERTSVSRSWGYFFDITDVLLAQERKQSIEPTDLLISVAGRFAGVFRLFMRAAERIKVYQISPTKSRESGVPIPRPKLDRLGGNLPAVIDLMAKRDRVQWGQVMQKMRSILPDLVDITVDYTSSRMLGLLIRERGYARPWSVGEISDGTIQTLALLVAVYSSDSTALVIEEPENSIHPWVMRKLLEACREASNTKQIIITSHSPVLMNMVKPDEIRIVWRAHGETHLSELSDLSEGFSDLWQRGEISTFDYIDSGIVSEAIPPSSALESAQDEE